MPNNANQAARYNIPGLTIVPTTEPADVMIGPENKYTKVENMLIDS